MHKQGYNPTELQTALEALRAAASAPFPADARIAETKRLIGRQVSWKVSRICPSDDIDDAVGTIVGYRKKTGEPIIHCTGTSNRPYTNRSTGIVLDPKVATKLNIEKKDICEYKPEKFQVLPPVAELYSYLTKIRKTLTEWTPSDKRSELLLLTEDSLELLGDINDPDLSIIPAIWESFWSIGKQLHELEVLAQFDLKPGDQVVCSLSPDKKYKNKYSTDEIFNPSHGKIKAQVIGIIQTKDGWKPLIEYSEGLDRLSSSCIGAVQVPEKQVNCNGSHYSFTESRFAVVDNIKALRRINIPIIDYKLNKFQEASLSQSGYAIGDRFRDWFGIEQTVVGVGKNHPHDQDVILTYTDIEGVSGAGSLTDWNNSISSASLPYKDKLALDHNRFLCYAPGQLASLKKLSTAPNSQPIMSPSTNTNTTNDTTQDVNELKRSLQELQDKFNQIHAQQSEPSPPKPQNLILHDLTEAGYRILSTQLVKGCQAAAVHSLEAVGAGNEKVEAVAGLLETEYGRAVLSMVLGMSLTYLSPFQDKPRLAKVAQECRIQSIALAGNELFSDLVSLLTPVLVDALSSINEEDQQSVSSSSEEELGCAENASAISVPADENAGTISNFA